MRLLVYDMLVNANGIYYAHVCEQARWARSAGNSAIENLCIIYYYYYLSSKLRHKPVIKYCSSNLNQIDFHKGKHD